MEIESIYETVVDAPYPVQPSRTELRKFRFAKQVIDRCAEHDLRTEIVHAFVHVIPGMKGARHIFRGLKRGIHDGSDLDQGPNKLIYCWTPPRDCIWLGGIGGGPVQRDPPAGEVFVVIVSPNPSFKVDGVAGWIERWNWVDEDDAYRGMPLGCMTRYEQHLWTRA